MAGIDTREKALEQIQRLKEIRVDRGATPAEAATAAAVMTRLLEKWQLSMLDVESGSYGESIDEVTTEITGAKVNVWEYALAKAVALPLDCQYFTNMRAPEGCIRRQRVMVFVGHNSDCRLAQYLYQTLARTLMGMATRQGKEQGYKRGAFVTYKAEFIIAAASVIYTRLKEEKEQRMQASVSSRALVAVKGAPLTKYMEQHYPNLSHTSTSRKSGGTQAQLDGMRAGKSVELRKGIYQEHTNPIQLPGG